LFSVPTFGDVTCVQDVPFQCSISVWKGEGPDAYRPTAHTFDADTAATAKRSLSVAPGFGMVFWLQAVPFQCRTNP
jgi:hypothetical protein